MDLTKILVLVLLINLLSGCGSKLSDNYHMEKKYWDISDYDAALSQLKYNTSEEEGLPRLSDPLTAPVFSKLVDNQNVSIVLEDGQLGLKHRNEVAKEFFNISKDIIDIYQVLDIQDKFVYPIELVRAIEFGLHTQLLYFKVGNAAIVKDAIGTDSLEVKRIINSNEQIAVNNFNIFIEYLSKEDAFNETALNNYADMINKYYSSLIKEFPSANYNQMKNTALALSKRVKTQLIKSALENLILKINAVK